MSLRCWLSKELRERPRLYDLARRLRATPRYPAARFLDGFSRAHGRRVRFVQIGANDGMRSDPIRGFVVRDRWSGVLVEPLPTVFELLKANYRHLRGRGLTFVNAAISDADAPSLPFWSYDERFLAGLALEERLEFLRKASFDRRHALGFARMKGLGESILSEIRVPCLALPSLLARHAVGDPVDLLVIDAEGHEPAILSGLKRDTPRIEAIFFESHNLGDGRGPLFRHLEDLGYRLFELEGDAVALQPDSPMIGRMDGAWIVAPAGAGCPAVGA